MLTGILKGAAAASAAAVLVLGAATRTSAAIGDPPLDPVPPTSAAALLVPSPAAPSVDPGAFSSQAHTSPGAATASGLRITPLGICVSCTDATAGSTDGRSSATALRVLGADVAGGTSSGSGSHGGALVAAPANPILTLAIAEWIAETRAHSSHSKTALLDIVILPHGHESGGTATVCVVDTESQDTTTDTETQKRDEKKSDEKKSDDKKSDTGTKEAKHDGQSSADAAKADAGDGAVMVALAHSDASSDGMGKAFVAGVGKQELVSSEQSGDEIPVKIPGVDVIAVHHDPSDAANTQSSVVQADDTAAQPDQPTHIAGAITASAASPPTVVTAPATSSPAARTPTTGSVGGGSGVTGVPSTGAALGAGGVLTVLAGAALAAGSLRRRR